MRFIIVTLLLTQLGLGNKVLAEEQADFSNEPKFIQLLMQDINNSQALGQHTTASLEFIHRGDDRCIGEFQGEIQLEPGNQIDDDFTIPMAHSGGGWACEDEKPKTYISTIKFPEALASSYFGYEFSHKKLSWTMYNDSQIIEIFFTPDTPSTKSYKIKKIIYSIEDPG